MTGMQPSESGPKRVLDIWQRLQNHVLTDARSADFQNKIETPELTKMTTANLFMAANRAMSANQGRLLLSDWLAEATSLMVERERADQEREAERAERERPQRECEAAREARRQQFSVDWDAGLPERRQRDRETKAEAEERAKRLALEEADAKRWAEELWAAGREGREKRAALEREATLAKWDAMDPDRQLGSEIPRRDRQAKAPIAEELCPSCDVLIGVDGRCRCSR